MSKVEIDYIRKKRGDLFWKLKTERNFFDVLNVNFSQWKCQQSLLIADWSLSLSLSLLSEILALQSLAWFSNGFVPNHFYINYFVSRWIKFHPLLISCSFPFIPDYYEGENYEQETICYSIPRDEKSTFPSWRMEILRSWSLEFFDIFNISFNLWAGNNVKNVSNVKKNFIKHLSKKNSLPKVIVAASNQPIGT